MANCYENILTHGYGFTIQLDISPACYRNLFCLWPGLSPSLLIDKCMYVCVFVCGVCVCECAYMDLHMHVCTC